MDRQAIEHLVQIDLQFSNFLGLQQSLEDVKSVSEIGVQNCLVELAIGGEAERSAIPESQGLGPALPEIGLHRLVFSPEIGSGYGHARFNRQCQVAPSSTMRFSRSAPGKTVRVCFPERKIVPGSLPVCFPACTISTPLTNT